MDDHMTQSHSDDKNHKIEYFLQITSFTEEDLTVRLDVLKKNKTTTTFHICDCNKHNILSKIKIRKNKLFASTIIEIEDVESDSNSFEIAVYDARNNAIVLSNIVKLRKYPPNKKYSFANYKPQPIDADSIIKVIDETNNKLLLYWNIPSNTFGDNIFYKMIGFYDDSKTIVNISILPFSIPLANCKAPEIFHIETISVIDNNTYHSQLSKQVDISAIKMQSWCNQYNLSNIYCKLFDDGYSLSKISLLSSIQKNNLCNRMKIVSADKTRFLKHLPKISNKNRKRILYNVPFTHLHCNDDEKKENITLLVVGKTGEGKTSTINSLMNYLFDTTFEGDRYRLIVEDFTDKQSTQSQTEKVSVYHIQPTHPEINYSITIVDTPGFANCDDRGRKFDAQIGKQLHKLFKTKITQINAICLIMRAGITRLTEEQSYVFTQIVDKFAQNVADNIILMFTFDDGTTPPNALSAVNYNKVKIHHRGKYFAFNNRGFDFDEKDIDYTKQYQFKQGMETFEQFFKEVTITKPQSLRLSAKQLQQKAKLRDIISEFSNQLDETVSVCGVIVNRIKEIKAYYGDDNPMITTSHYVNLKQRVTNDKFELEEFYVCNICETTVSQNWYQSTFNFAPQCPQGHFATKQQYRYILKQVQKKRKVRDTDEILKLETYKLKKMEKVLTELIGVIKHKMKKIKKIAMDSNTLSINEYVSVLIQEVKYSGKENTFDKVKLLKYLQRKTQLFEKIDKETMSIDIESIFLKENNLETNLKKKKKKGKHNKKKKNKHKKKKKKKEEKE